MGAYILIILMLSHSAGTGVATAEFASKNACVRAKTEVERIVKTYPRVKVICVPHMW